MTAAQSAELVQTTRMQLNAICKEKYGSKLWIEIEVWRWLQVRVISLFISVGS